MFGNGASIKTSLMFGCSLDGSGFFLDSLNCPKVPRSGTYFLFFVPLTYLEPVFNRDKVFPFFSVEIKFGLIYLENFQTYMRDMA